MDTVWFLDNVVAPGNYLALTVNRSPNKPGGFFVRLFERKDTAQAASFAAWAVRKGWDVYHSNASFVTAEPDGADPTGAIKYKGNKSASNAQYLKAFWLDLDCKRDGDKKDPAQVFASQAHALAWVCEFYQKANLPKPTLFVNSGYGLHVYWVMEDPIAVPAWLPYAQRLKEAVLAHGFTGDVGVIADAARILRPAGTTNNKVPEAPAQVDAISALTSAAIPNAVMLDALGKLVAATTVIQPVTVTGTLGGTVSPILAAHARNAPNMGAAAAAGVHAARPRYMKNIVPKCGQVSTTLAVGGKGDKYGLWYLGMLSLAHFCEDGKDYVHKLSEGDAKYTEANVDFHVERIAKEHALKQHGPPSCSLFNSERAGICHSCPAWGKINSPWQHGIDDGDLPPGYRRGNQRVEYARRNRDETWWDELVPGDVHSPSLDITPNGVVLSFIYTRSAIDYPVQVADHQLTSDASALRRLFAPQFVTLNSGMEPKFGEFLVSWIQELRKQNVMRADVASPYGWYTTQKGHGGFAIGGELYLPGGAVERVGGGDRQIHAMYQPAGTLEPWKDAANLVVKGRPALATIVAVSFGSPLMKLTGQSGMINSAWSRASGVGKTAAITVGQAVWAQKKAMSATNDTPNSIARKAGEVKVLPIYWDETLVGQNNIASFVNLVFQMAQGKERSRLTADSTMRETGEWQTIVCTAGNRPLMDTVMQETESTQAGALRVFEYMLPEEAQPNDPGATNIIAAAETNYGHAGRIYAKWLAMNQPLAVKTVAFVMEQFTADLQAMRDERLYIAGMSCIYAGATIAKSLGLVEFELPELRRFLCDTFNALRVARNQASLVSPLGYDMRQILGQFVSDHASQIITTNYFMRTGHGASPTISLAPGPNAPAVVIHIGEKNQAMRINRMVLIAWARKQRLPGLDIVSNMEKMWGATLARNTLAGGTAFGVSQVWCVEIPLGHPDLQSYLPDPPP